MPNLRDIAIDFGDAYTRLEPPDRAAAVSKLMAIFTDHYAVVIYTFRSGTIPQGLQPELATLVPLEQQFELARDARKQSEIILSTFVRQIEIELMRNDRKSFAGQIERKDKINNAAKRGKWSVVLISSMRKAWAHLKTRIPTIANINTQGIAEQTRVDGMVNALAQRVVQIGGTAVNRWESLLDGRERDAHGHPPVGAHGQVQPITKPFVVGGELLRFPGDTSLGASLGNVINCRCSAIFYQQMDDGKLVPLGFHTGGGRARRTRRTGDRVGNQIPGNPTSSFTFATGRSRGRIVLGNGDVANYSVTGSAITIRVGGRAVASAPLSRNSLGQFLLGPVTVAPSHAGTGIDGVLRASVEATNRLKSP